MIRALLCACLVLAGPAARAEPPPTTEQAKAQGYEPRGEGERPGSLLGGAIAVGPGFLVHGLGHYYAGDTPTALTLLLSELAGIGLIIAGSVVDENTNGAGPTGGLRNALTHTGVLLFFGSWVADIVGTFKGAESFAPNSRRTSGNVFGIAYRFTDNPLTPFKHHLVTRLSLDNGRVWVRPEVDLEVALDLWQVALDTGVRLFVGDNPHNRFGVGVNGRRYAVPRFGYAATSAAAFIDWQVDLGMIVRGMRNFYLFNRTGYGTLGLQFGDNINETPGIGIDFDFVDSYLLFETGIALNTGRKTNVSLAVIQDPTRDLAPASADGGMVELSLLYRQSSDLDIELTGTSGDGWGVWLGLGYGL